MAKKSKKTKAKKPEPNKKEKPKLKRKKGARKKFFEVEIPLTNTKIHLFGYSPEELEGNFIKLDLTKALKGKSLELKAKVVLEGEKLKGELISLQIAPSYIKRAMRRGSDYVEDSFQAKCKDSTLVIKPFMITRKRVSRIVRKTIRDTAKKHLESKATTRNTEELFSEIMSNKLQKELSLKIKKIYPLALCEIRTFYVLKKEGNTLKKKTKEEKSNKKETKSEK